MRGRLKTHQKHKPRASSEAQERTATQETRADPDGGGNEPPRTTSRRRRPPRRERKLRTPQPEHTNAAQERTRKPQTATYAKLGHGLRRRQGSHHHHTTTRGSRRQERSRHHEGRPMEQPRWRENGAFAGISTRPSIMSFCLYRVTWSSGSYISS